MVVSIDLCRISNCSVASLTFGSRKNHCTISCREVHDRAAAVVQQHVGLEDCGYKCRASVLLNILFFAASRVGSIFAACRNIENAPTQQAVFNALVMVVADGVVLCNLPEGLVAVSVRNGEELWTAPGGLGFHAPLDAFVINGSVWTGHHPGDPAPPPVDDFNVIRDLHTGKVQSTNDVSVNLQSLGHHHQCYRNPTGAKAKDKIKRRRPGNFSDMITYMDKVIGKLVARLDELGLRENTLVLFTTDNAIMVNPPRLYSWIARWIALTLLLAKKTANFRPGTTFPIIGMLHALID